MATRSSKIVLAATGALTGAGLAYWRLLRRPALTWGATSEEANSRLPGDVLLEDADIVSTRAVTIGAPVSAVWPWLLQMGSGRGGAYTYDWIENLFGLDMQSVDRVVPELQHLKVGDVMRNGKGGPGLRLEILDPEHVLSWRSEDGRWVWTFVLEGKDGVTRLLSRNRISTKRSPFGTQVGMLVVEPGSLVMERKMLIGIKERAEKLVRPREDERGRPVLRSA